MLGKKQTKNAERLSAEKYAIAAKDLNIISALPLDLVTKNSSFNRVVKDYRKNNHSDRNKLSGFLKISSATNFVTDTAGVTSTFGDVDSECSIGDNS